MTNAFDRSPLSGEQLEEIYEVVRHLRPDELHSLCTSILRQTERFPPNPVALFARLASSLTRSRIHESEDSFRDPEFRQWEAEELARIGRLEERYSKEEALAAFREMMERRNPVAVQYFKHMIEPAARNRDDKESFLERHRLIFGRAVLDQRSKRKPRHDERTKEEGRGPCNPDEQEPARPSRLHDSPDEAVDWSY